MQFNGREDHSNGTTTLWTVKWTDATPHQLIGGHAQDYEDGRAISDIYDLSLGECHEYTLTLPQDVRAKLMAHAYDPIWDYDEDELS